MTRTRRNIEAITEALEAASATADDGSRYVRAHRACRIIGVHASIGQRWESAGWVRAERFRVPVSNRAPQGVVVAWPLADAIACAKTYRSQDERRWTQADDDALMQHIAYESMELLSRRLGRTIDAIRRRALMLGVHRLTASGELTTGDVAGLVGRTRECVQLWCFNYGLRYRRAPGGHGEKLIDPPQLRLFLEAHPLIWRGLSPIAKQRIQAIEVFSADRSKAREAA